MITAIADFLGSVLGRVALAGGLFASFVAWRAWDVHQQREIGETRAQVQMEKTAHANASKAEKAARTVDAIPDDRLFDAYFRDR
jgi:hypothetical protein